MSEKTNKPKVNTENVYIKNKNHSITFDKAAKEKVLENLISNGAKSVDNNPTTKSIFPTEQVADARHYLENIAEALAEKHRSEVVRGLGQVAASKLKALDMIDKSIKVIQHALTGDYEALVQLAILSAEVLGGVIGGSLGGVAGSLVIPGAGAAAGAIAGRAIAADQGGKLAAKLAEYIVRESQKNITSHTNIKPTIEDVDGKKYSLVKINDVYQWYETTPVWIDRSSYSRAKTDFYPVLDQRIINSLNIVYTEESKYFLTQDKIKEKKIQKEQTNNVKNGLTPDGQEFKSYSDSDKNVTIKKIWARNAGTIYEVAYYKDKNTVINKIIYYDLNGKTLGEESIATINGKKIKTVTPGLESLLKNAASAAAKDKIQASRQPISKNKKPSNKTASQLKQVVSDSGQGKVTMPSRPILISVNDGNIYRAFQAHNHQSNLRTSNV
ncbi:hypothetical protein HZU77_003105 [Neisseriaceae bacterium TC5R-5]|nr:hypothetical protein [Neisseriaceae bacterium TC5R-5]